MENRDLIRYFVLLFVSLTVLVHVKAKPYVDSIKINSKVPEHFWEIPLTILNNSGEEKTYNLSQYRGKSIILDFLSTGCASCMAALPNIKSLSDKFDDLVFFPVTKQESSHVNFFYERNQVIKKLGVPFVVKDTILNQLFPHKFISHLVWIDQSGIVRAMTGTSMVTSHTLKEFMKNKALDWPVKVESTSFFNKPIFGQNNASLHSENNQGLPLYYSAVTGFVEGVNGFTSILDSTKGFEIRSYRNRSILDMYLTSVGELYKLKSKQIIFEVQNPNRLAYWKNTDSNIPFEMWIHSNGISYEASFPLGMSLSNRNEQIRGDLNRFLGLNGRMEVKEVDCLVLIRCDSSFILEYTGKARENSLLNTINSSDIKRLTGFPLSSLINALEEEQFGYPLVLDGTHFKNAVDLQLNVRDLGNLEDLRMALRKYGLDLVHEKRKIEFLIITENKY